MKSTKNMKFTNIKKILSLLILILLPVFLLSCEKSGLEKKKLTLITKDGTQVSVSAELAITPEERNFGFMEREKIPDGTGMLFIFEKDQKLTFWMKNTPHPLTIAYIDSEGTIRDILDMTPFSLATVPSSVSVRYALEVPQGWFKKVNITEGDKLVLDFLD